MQRMKTNWIDVSEDAVQSFKTALIPNKVWRKDKSTNYSVLGPPTMSIFYQQI